jgi:hypothetical protein
VSCITRNPPRLRAPQAPLPNSPSLLAMGARLGLVMARTTFASLLPTPFLLASRRTPVISSFSRPCRISTTLTSGDPNPVLPIDGWNPSFPAFVLSQDIVHSCCRPSCTGRSKLAVSLVWLISVHVT